jgi:hypothetical protein
VRIASIEPIGSPRYSIGNTAAAARASASRSPFQAVSVIAASATNPETRMASSATPVPNTRSPIQCAPPTLMLVSIVAAHAAENGIGVPPAAASRAYSTNASTSSTSATAKNMSG